MTDFIQEKVKEFIEKGADLEHNRWAKWQAYLHSKCFKDKQRNLIIPSNFVAHWERQIKTPYSELSEKEKESDRIEVREYIPLLEFVITEAYNRGVQDSIKCVPDAMIERENIDVGPINIPDVESQCFNTCRQQTLDNLNNLIK